uniref:Uncharacterized protein n=1 Tax=Siphoviridae sp. ctg8v2 TaxID=2825604 RepID=A0A8S5US88_9CAUD|nr:MAG TPA: hypothetical protein [Siphoviridae sp. ctg8v2]DAO02958.1 MAG TPA: hypothetical protein [Caudoviricetes sp.]DAO63188.1 MAG TPA: hypothetical protein [Caudoviricetes sp.]
MVYGIKRYFLRVKILDNLLMKLSAKANKM